MENGQALDIVSTLSQHGFGEHAANIQRQGYKPQQKDGVTVYSGADRGVPFRFFIYTPVLEHKSKTQGYKECDAIEAIEWLTSKSCHPTALLRPGHIPTELLEFDAHTIPQEFHPEHGYQINTTEYHEQLRQLKPVGGLLYEAYVRWKEGRQAEGHLLSRCEWLGERDLATLNENGIFTLEQLAEYPPDRTRRWSEHMRELQEQAIQELNKEEHMQKAQAEIAKLGDIEKMLAKLEAENKELRAKIEAGELVEDKPKRTRAKAKTEKTEE